MQVFEFHFNPKAKEDLIFDSFCYEPENIYEKRLGSLFLVGELRNVLPQNLKFLDNLAVFLKKHYYSAPIKFSPEASLKESLKKANEFLENITKKGDVSWLGNLNLAVLSLKNFDLNFTKVGTAKILLIRPGQIIDIGKNLEFSEIEPYPLKIFSNIVSGKLAENDIILILTKEVFDFFSNQNLLNEVAEIVPFEEKKLREILKTKERDLLKISGICLLCLLTKEVWPAEKKLKAFTFQKEAENFVNKIRGLLRLNEVLKKLPKLKIPRPEIRISLKKPKIKFTPLKTLFLTGFSANLRKNLILVLLLIFFLLLGFFIFK